MQCFYPLQAWRGKVGSNGKRSVVFHRRDGFKEFELKLPCGQCRGCRLERSRQWALRCLHESELYDRNCFITLTYDDDHISQNRSIDVREFQLFMKKLRKYFSGEKIRFFHCGEYGEKFGRPHYHACLFNFDFDDKVLHSIRNGFRLYVSDTLNHIWNKGQCMIGDVTFESAAYVARYIMKKITGDRAVEHYDGRKPEYVTMSRRPGLGSDWFKKFKSDVYPSDFVVSRGVKMRPPKFYDTLFDLENPELLASLKRARARRFDRLENDAFRLRDKEIVKSSQIKSLLRPLEVI